MPLRAEPDDVVCWWLPGGKVVLGILDQAGRRQSLCVTEDVARELLETLGRMWARRFGCLVVKDE